jgi:Mce-associated membrane protein
MGGNGQAGRRTVENQQPDPDDLTDESPDSNAPAEDDTGDTEAEARTAESVCALAGDDGSAGTARARFGGWPAAAVGTAAALFVGSAAFAGAAVQPYLVDRAVVATRLDIARTAAAAITTLWTYTPDTIDTLADRAADYLSGDFDAQYRKFVEAVVAPNKQAQVTDNTQVVGVGVESLNGTEAVAMVFTNTTATSPLTKNIPSLKYVGYRLDMKHQGSRWLVTKMATISFTDLTPQL